MILASSLTSVDGKIMVMMLRFLMTAFKRQIPHILLLTLGLQFLTAALLLCSSLQRPKATFPFVSVWLPTSVRHRISPLSADSFPMYSKTIGGNLASNQWTWRFKGCHPDLRFRREDPVQRVSSIMPNCTDVWLDPPKPTTTDHNRASRRRIHSFVSCGCCCLTVSAVFMLYYSMAFLLTQLSIW